MKILKEIKKVTDNKVLINLPDGFFESQVEITIRPVIKRKNKARAFIRAGHTCRWQRKGQRPAKKDSPRRGWSPGGYL